MLGVKGLRVLKTEISVSWQHRYCVIVYHLMRMTKWSILAILH